MERKKTALNVAPARIACWVTESILMCVSVGFFIATLVSVVQTAKVGEDLGSVLFRLMICAEAILFLCVPYILNHITGGRFILSDGFEIVFAIYAFCGTIVGDMLNAFAIIPFWDSIMHAFSGEVLCYVGYLLADIMNRKQAEKGGAPNGFFLALFAVCLAVALGSVWELIEYASDDLLGTNSQQFMETTTGTFVTEEDVPLVGHLALRDTIKDMFLNTTGVVCAACVIAPHRAKKERERVLTEEKAATIVPYRDCEATDEEDLKSTVKSE